MSATANLVPGSSRTSLRLSIAIFAVVALSFGVLVPFVDTERVVAMFNDDAFYYFTVARNVAAGDGFTFDGIHRTNGFQPLWELVLIPLFAVVPGDVLPLRAVLLLQTLLIALSSVLLYRTLEPRLGPAASAAGALFMVVFLGAPPILRAGMESSLLLVALIMLWRAWLAVAAAERPHRAASLRLGCWAAIAFLARLEAGILSPILLLLGWRRWRRDPIAAIVFCAPVAATLFAYLAWNRLMFDTWIPVSGMIKAEWVQTLPLASKLRQAIDLPWFGQGLVCRLFNRPSLVTLQPAGKAVYAALLLVTVGLVWRYRADLNATIVRAGGGFPLIGCAAIIVFDKVTVFFISPWYQAPYVLASGLLAAVVLYRWPRLARVFAVGCAAGLLLRIGFELLTLRKPASRYASHRIEAGLWVRANVGPEVRIGSWNAGTFGYFARHHVVNLDGLVNDVAYHRHLQVGGTLEEYFAREGITWLGDQGCAHATPAGYLARGRAAHLADRFTVVERFYDASHPNGCPGFLLWRMTPGGG